MHSSFSSSRECDVLPAAVKHVVSLVCRGIVIITVCSVTVAPVNAWQGHAQVGWSFINRCCTGSFASADLAAPPEYGSVRLWQLRVAECFHGVLAGDMRSKHPNTSSAAVFFVAHSV
jgi:hypothetical protein